MILKDEIKKFNIDLGIYYLRRFVKISLVFSIFCLSASIILNLIFKDGLWEPDSISGAIIWYSIIIAFYSIIFSAIVILVLIVCCLIRKYPIWKSVKKEVILLLLGIFMLMILWLTNYIINKN